MSYCIMNVDKQRRSAVYGLQIEANRTKDDGREFDSSDIDKSLTDQNIFLKKSEDWNRTITKQIHDRNLKERSDSVVMITGVYTMSPEWFDDPSHTRDDMMQYFRECLDFHVREYCQGDETLLLNGVVHMDEKTPHLQVASIPIVTDEKGDHLSAKIIMGNRDAYRFRQDRFFEEVGSHFDMTRGERRDPTERKAHMTKREWQKATLEAEIDSLESHRDKIASELSVTSARLSEAHKDLEDTEATVKNQESHILSLADAIDEGRSKLQKTQKELQRIKVQIDSQKSEMDAIEAQIKASQKELLHQQGKLAQSASKPSIFGEKVTIDKKTYDDLWSSIRDAYDREKRAYGHTKEAAASLSEARRLEKSLEPRLKALTARESAISSKEKALSDKESQIDRLIDVSADRKFRQWVDSLQHIPDGKPRLMEKYLQDHGLLEDFEAHHRQQMRALGLGQDRTL